jgi:hypothetical protein
VVVGLSLVALLLEQVAGRFLDFVIRLYERLLHDIEEMEI